MHATKKKKSNTRLVHTNYFKKGNRVEGKWPELRYKSSRIYAVNNNTRSIK